MLSLSRAAVGQRSLYACALVTGLTLAFSLLSPSEGQAKRAHVVTYDSGGSVMARYQEINEFRLKGTRVEVRGQCMSACTMYLGLPNTCVSPSAIFGFHGPRDAGQNQPMPNSFAAKLMAAHYPGDLQAWFLAEAQYLPGNSVARLSGKQLISMGISRC